LTTHRLRLNIEPNTLQGAILYFASPDNCREYLMARNMHALKRARRITGTGGKDRPP
jgi:hypothetical protein